MSIDEAISLAVASGEQQPTLRFYGWKKPTLSLGYFQKLDESQRFLASRQQSPVDNHAIEIVRRSTGGGAIIHDHEWTYSLSLPLADNGPGPRETVYQSVHQIIRDTLARSSVMARPFHQFDQTVAGSKERAGGLRTKTDEAFLCFQRRTREDLICNGYKILGSAQRRVRGGILQHGSLLLSVSRWADVLPGIRELTNVDVNIQKFSTEIADCLGRELEIEFAPGVLTDAEIESSDRIQGTRYAADEWTRRR